MWRCLLLAVCLLVNWTKTDNIECPPGAIRPPNSNFCYGFNSKLLDFYGAESACNLQGGHLAYIDSAFTNAAIGANAKKLSWDQYWIGANVIRLTINDAIVRIWAWIGSDRYVKYSDWYINEPNPNDNCAVGKTIDSTWIASNCAENRSFICSIPIKIDVCDDGWTHFNETDFCYKVFYNETFDDAELVCRAENAHLTSIHSESENNFIVALSKAGILVNSGNTTWIGLYSPTNGSNVNSYKWTDGSMTNYTKWAPNQPDNLSEKCVHIVSDNITNIWPHLIGDWNNGSCDEHFRNFVCKKNASMIQYSY